MEWWGSQVNAAVSVVSTAIGDIVDEVEDTLDTMMGPAAVADNTQETQPTTTTTDASTAPPQLSSPARKDTSAIPTTPITAIHDIIESDEEEEGGDTQQTHPTEEHTPTPATPQQRTPALEKDDGATPLPVTPTPATPATPSVNTELSPTKIDAVLKEWDTARSKTGSYRGSEFPEAMDAIFSEIEMELAVEGDVKEATLSSFGAMAVRCMQTNKDPDAQHAYFTERLAAVNRLAEMTASSPSACGIPTSRGVESVRQQTALLQSAVDTFIRRM